MGSEWVHAARAKRENRYWVFDSPLIRDPLFLVGLAVGLAVATANWVTWPEDAAGSPNLVIATWQVLSAVFFVGTLGGIVREYRRGRRDGRTNVNQSADA